MIKKILITGHKGFIGINLVEFLSSYNYSIEGIDYPNNLLNLTSFPLNFDCIIHLAAETDVRKSIEDSGSFLRNIKMTNLMLDLARVSNIPFIYVSSCGAINSLSPYTASKNACEALCKAYISSYQTKISVLRLSNVYGSNSLHKSSVVASFIKSSLDEKPIKIYGDGNQTRDFVYIVDVCDMIHKAMYCYGFYNVASGVSISINDLIKEIEKLSHKKLVTENHKKIPGEIYNSTIKTNVINPVPLQRGLKLTYEWFRNNY